MQKHLVASVCPGRVVPSAGPLSAWDADFIADRRIFHEHAGFEEALTSRVDDMRNAFFTACPITAASAAPTRKPWSRVCSTSCGSAKAPRNPRVGEVLQASGECIKACNYGVNPRFLLTMARLSMMRYDKEPAQRRRAGVNQFRKVGEDVGVLSRLQLSEGDLDWLDQQPAKEAPRAEFPDECSTPAATCTRCRTSRRSAST